MACRFSFIVLMIYIVFWNFAIISGKLANEAIYNNSVSYTKTLFILGNTFPANTKHLHNICTTSAQRLRRCSNFVQMLYKCFVFTGLWGDVYVAGPTLSAHQVGPLLSTPDCCQCAGCDLRQVLMELMNPDIAGFSWRLTSMIPFPVMEPCPVNNRQTPVKPCSHNSFRLANNIHLHRYATLHQNCLMKKWFTRIGFLIMAP